MDYTVNDIITVMSKKGYPVFDTDDSPFNLNLIAIRNSDRVSNEFNDSLYVLYKHLGRWSSLQYAITTDPGLVYRNKPINQKGTAIVLPGFYKGLWKLGLHKGKYKALVQAAPVNVARDNNKDHILDINNAPIVEAGFFGINCHKSGRGTTELVNYYSAGCIVHSDNERYEKEFIPLCEAAANNFGDSFSFSLLDQIEFY